MGRPRNRTPRFCLDCRPEWDALGSVDPVQRNVPVKEGHVRHDGWLHRETCVKLPRSMRKEVSRG